MFHAAQLTEQWHKFFWKLGSNYLKQDDLKKKIKCHLK